MKTVFKQATRYFSTDEIVTSPDFAKGTFEYAADIQDFYDRVCTHLNAQGVSVEGGFLYGGALTDAITDKKPRDFDLYISSPQMLDILKDYIARGAPREYDMNDEEWGELIWGYRLPFQPSLGIEYLNMNSADILGDYAEFYALALGGEINGRFVDIKLGTRLPKLEDFLCHIPAPIMAAGMTLGPDARYAYHRDFVDHTERGLLCTTHIHSPSLIQKAEQKRLELITPDALAARDKNVISLSRYRSNGNTPARHIA